MVCYYAKGILIANFRIEVYSLGLESKSRFLFASQVLCFLEATHSFLQQLLRPHSLNDGCFQAYVPFFIKELILQIYKKNVYFKIFLKKVGTMSWGIYHFTLPVNCFTLGVAFISIMSVKA